MLLSKGGIRTVVASVGMDGRPRRPLEPSMQDPDGRYFDRDGKMLVGVGLVLVSWVFMDAFSVQGGQGFILIRLSSPVSGLPLMLGRSNHLQHCIFGLHESVNMADADLVELLDRRLVILMVFPMVLLIIVHEKWVEAFAEGQVFR